MTNHTYIDPRGIKRTLLTRDRDGNVTFDCGHAGKFNPIFHHEIGTKHFCYKCGKEAKADDLTIPAFLDRKNAICIALLAAALVTATPAVAHPDHPTHCHACERE